MVCGNTIPLYLGLLTISSLTHDWVDDEWIMLLLVWDLVEVLKHVSNGEYCRHPMPGRFSVYKRKYINMLTVDVLWSSGTAADCRSKVTLPYTCFVHNHEGHV